MRRGSGIVTLVVLLWLIIGAVAAGQRGYYDDDDLNCSETGDIVLTILAGPLNYVGVNPEVDCDDLPDSEDFPDGDDLPEPSE